ncbi:calcium-binding protein, partial [Klebsiella quasipneumoniae]|uniref:calcium-binding protein n=1 Tax=Klebsiella quasipneumoniae TaxID=1463165 RepID=UPI003450DA2C
GFAADVDALVFGVGIAASDILVEHSAEAPQDVVLRIAGTTDRVVLRHQSLSDGTGSIEEVRFADGTSLTLRDLMNRYLAPAFTGGADTRLGFDG